MREELLQGLSQQQIEKVKACKNQEEILKAAKEEGIELNDDQLEAVSGGGCYGTTPPCPKCGASKDHIEQAKNLLALKTAGVADLAATCSTLTNFIATYFTKTLPLF